MVAGTAVSTLTPSIDFHDQGAVRDTEDGRDAVARVIRAVAVSDGVAVALPAVAAATLIDLRHGLSPALAVLVAIGVAVLSVPSWLAVLSLSRAYERRHLFAGSGEVRRVVAGGAAVSIIASAAGWLFLERPDAPIVLTAVALLVILTVAGRWIVRMRAQEANRSGVMRSRVLVVGEGDEVPRVIGRLRRNLYHGWAVVASCSLDERHARWGADRTRATIAASAALHRADMVLLTPSASARLGTIADLQRTLHDEGRDLALAPPLVEAVGPRVTVDSVCGLPVLRIGAPEFRGPRRFVKAVADRGVAALSLLVLLVPMLLVGLAVRLDSRGPAIFRQARVGRHGQIFNVWKFRTMFRDAEARLAAIQAENEGAGPLFKMKSDPRVTRLGRILRKTSLDELPQLVNVLLGQMSIVGPRPALPREVAQYDEVTRRRLLVRPGITGLWQISGRSDLSWEETKRLDIRYVENWSLGFDLSIVVRTVDVVIRRKGAY